MNRKNALLTILSVTLLLCGCNSGSKGGGKKKNSSIVSDSSSSPTLTTTGETSSTSQTLTSTSSLPSGQYKVYTAGNALPFSDFGIHISDLESEKTNRDLLMNSINSQAKTKIVSSINAVNCQIATDDGSSEKEHLHLSIGSGANFGSIQFNLSQVLKKAVIEASGYYKTYNGGVSKDPNSKIIINGIEYNFTTLDADPHPQVETFTVEYPDGVNFLKFANDADHQRFFLNSIHLFF